jgi:hypothetical protein
MKTTIAAALVLLLLGGIASADDLYRVTITSAEDAEQLRRSGAEAIARINGGFLVLAKDQTVTQLVGAGLSAEMIASDVDKQHLAFDNRLDDANRANYPMVFEEGDLRLYRVDMTDPTVTATDLQVVPVAGRTAKISYHEPTPVGLKDLSLRSIDVPLDSLASLVQQGSVEEFMYTLQAFPPRVQGSAGNFAARDWIYDEFVRLGYDSVYLDPFSSGYNNVVAVKVGTRFPDHQVVIGGHFDAVSGSPGADDNGSGTTGVLECARVLANIRCDMTIIFIAFDAEESGLNGSEHYAGTAAGSGDNIVLMFNMDMIGEVLNSGEVKTYHGDQMEYPNLFNQLADSLVGLTGHLWGNISASDHWPFHQEGYTIVMAHEYVFSTVYHSSQDNTASISFPYQTKVIKASLATCYVVSQTEGPVPALAFSYPNGLPDFVLPSQTTTIEVVVSGLYDGIPVPGSGTLYYNAAGQGWSAVSMTEISANRYEAVLPEIDCGQAIEYYFMAEETDEGEFRDPPALEGVYSAEAATEQQVLLDDSFDSDLGWTVSGGSWARGVPTGGGGEYGNPDPTSGHSGSNIFGYNLNGDYENNMIERHLTSPALDCSDAVNTTLSFWRWLGVETPSYDHAYVRVSTNGTSWTTIWSNAEEIEDGSWSEWTFDISAIADGEPTVYVRFTMGETDGSWQYCGWNIDDVQVVGYVCDDSSPSIITETLPDWTVGVAYSQQLTASGGAGVLSWSDRDGDLAGTGLSLSTTGLVSGTPTAAGPISFTARITDENIVTDDQLLAFTVNPGVAITTMELPSDTVGELYCFELLATGGTGTMTWTDKFGDLDDAGIALLPGGILDGTVLDTGVVSFTAVATDEPGDFDERAFSIYFAPAFRCGDVDDDGVGPDIVDLIYLVSYMFQGGPPPQHMGSVDVNGNLVGPDIEDLIFLVTFMFQDGPDLNCVQ